MRPEKQQRYRKSAESFTKRALRFRDVPYFPICADVIEAMLTMKAETMGISDGTWFAVLERTAADRDGKDGTVTVTREAHPGGQMYSTGSRRRNCFFHRWQVKGSKVPSEIWKNIPSDWFPLPAVLCDGRRIFKGNDCWEAEI